MKSNVMPSIVQIEATQLKQLVSEVKETVATDITNVKNVKKATPKFGVIDLWAIHRQKRSAHLGWSSVL